MNSQVTDPIFRTHLAQTVFDAKYSHERCETWRDLSYTLAEECVGPFAEKLGVPWQDVAQAIATMKFIPGGRYLRNAGRPLKYLMNCLLLSALSDTREDWADLSWRAESCLMSGGGIGVCYDIYRPSGSKLSRTGGISSGPVSKMEMINEIGRRVVQGGFRRSAMYSSLNWKHGDIHQFLAAKNWGDMKVGRTGYSLLDIKQQDFDFPAPLDMTNISVNYDTSWLMQYRETGEVGDVFEKNVVQALTTGEPGFSFNFFEKERETLRNAPLGGKTFVLTDFGYRMIEDIVERPSIVWTGRQWVETVFKKTGSLVPTIRIRMSNWRYIDADPSHEFFILDLDGRTIKKYAKDIRIGDRVYVSLPSSNITTSTCVVDKTRGPVQDVYCCDVGVEEHSFCAEGVIVSNCTEIVSEDDSDCCCLGSINLSRVESLEEFRNLVKLAIAFLLCGTEVSDLPYEKVRKVCNKNRRLGLGLMGIHEWLLSRGYKYEVVPELHQWLSVYRDVSDEAASKYANVLGFNVPIATRACAPTGTISTVAATTSGIEPIYAVAYKRRYLKAGRWHAQYSIDQAAQLMIDKYGLSPDQVESSVDLATDYERRIKFQADIQDYTDNALSSTISLPAVGSPESPDPKAFAQTLAKYAHRLRGFTCYPDGARGGQPLTSVPYDLAKSKLGEEFEENSSWLEVCEITKGGFCGS